MQILGNFYRYWWSPQVSKEKSNLLEQLPVEIALEVLSYLPSHTLVQLGKTCRKFHQLTQDYTLNIAKRLLFIKMRSERLTGLGGDWMDFVYTPRGIIETEGDTGNLTLKLNDYMHKKRINFLDFPVRNHDQLGDYQFVIYHREFLVVQFQHIESFTWMPPINISALINDKKNENHSYRYEMSYNRLTLLIKNQVIVIQDGLVVFQLALRGQRIVHFCTAGDSLVLTGIPESVEMRPKMYHQQRYSITSKECLSSRQLCKTLPFAKISTVRATSKYIITIAGLNHPNPYITINVCNLNFQFVSNYTVSISPQAYEQGRPEKTYGKDPFLYCHEDRLVMFINYKTLMFIDLTLGQLIKHYVFDVLEGEYTNAFRVCCNNENVMVMKKKSIELYDLWSGRFLHRFITAAKPYFMNFVSPYRFFFSYISKEHIFYSAQLTLKDDRHTQASRKKARKK